MIAFRIPLAFVVCVSIAACDRHPPPEVPPEPPPTPSPGPPPGEERITGSERLGWDQQATDAVELASFRYAMYVDGVRADLADVSCSTARGQAGFPCSVRLPLLSPGSHRLELTAFIGAGGVLESGRSAPLRVFVAAASSTAGAVGWQNGVLVTTTDRLRLRLDFVTGGLSEPTDLAFAPDGRLFVAERAGRVRIIREGRLEAQPALSLDDVTTGGEGGLLALALDPQFQRTGFVYTIYTSRADGGGPAFRLARFREAQGALAERAVLLDEVPAASIRPAASLRFGADGKLYAAFDDGGDGQRGGDLSSFNGKVLRLNPDGTTPADQAGATPVYSYDLRSPRGFDWQPTRDALWIADAGTDGSERLTVVVPGVGRGKRGSVDARYALPRPTGASAVAFYRGALIPGFDGDLLIAADEQRHILRLGFDRQRRADIVTTEKLLQDRVGPVRVVAISPRGEIYFCTTDALGRLGPP